MQVSDDRVALDDRLAVELEEDAHHAVGGRVLGAHVERHQALAGLQLVLVLDGQRAHRGRVGHDGARAAAALEVEIRYVIGEFGVGWLSGV